MTLASFQRLCSEFDVTGALLSKVQQAQIFRKAKFGVAEAGAGSAAEASASASAAVSPGLRLSFPGA